DPTGSVACREPPTVAPVAHEIHRIANRVLLLDKGSLSAVFKIVAAMLTHERVAQVTKVDPHVGELMGKQWAREEQLPIVDLLPLIGRTVGRKTLGGQRVGW